MNLTSTLDYGSWHGTAVLAAIHLFCQLLINEPQALVVEMNVKNASALLYIYNAYCIYYSIGPATE